MPLAQTPPKDASFVGLPGVVVVAGIRRTLIWTLIIAVLFPAFMSGSRGYCPGGVDGNGGFIDASGRPVDEAPMCVQLSLGPSPLVHVGIALIVLFAIGRVMKASDERAALRILERAIQGAGLLAVVAIIVSNVWFLMTPIEGFSSGSWSVFSPFPFGIISVEITPMS